MSLVAGSYERFIKGFTLHSQSLTPIFYSASHHSPVNTVTLCGSFVASGGSDEIIHLYNVATDSSSSLYHHSATITALSFYAAPHFPFIPLNLLSTDAAGNLSIFDADGFVHLMTLSVHRKAAIKDMALHPSGKLALTVASDQCFALVDLVMGCRTFCYPSGKEISLVKFNAAGDTFFMVAKEKVSVLDTEEARFLFEFQCSKRVLCAAPTRDGLLYTGGEDRSITAWDTKSGKVSYCLEEAHSARVNGIAVLTDSDGATGDDDPYLVGSASSNGIVRVWDVRMAAREKPLAEYNTQSRLTCLAGSFSKLNTKEGKKKQRKRRKASI